MVRNDVVLDMCGSGGDFSRCPWYQGARREEAPRPPPGGPVQQSDPAHGQQYCQTHRQTGTATVTTSGDRKYLFNL